MCICINTNTQEHRYIYTHTYIIHVNMHIYIHIHIDSALVCCFVWPWFSQSLSRAPGGRDLHLERLQQTATP